MILPYLNYSIETWFGACQTDCNKIFVLQKKAMRAIHNLPFNAHTNDYFKANRILKIHDLYKLNICSLVYRYTLCPNDLPSSTRFQSNANIHAYNTRHSNDLVVPRYNLTKSQKSFVYNSIHAWNSLPEEITSSNSIKSFKMRLKDYYCSLY